MTPPAPPSPTPRRSLAADGTVADDFGVRHGALAEHFSQEEILEIIGIGINMNVWTRLKLAEGATPGSPSRRCREPLTCQAAVRREDQLAGLLSTRPGAVANADDQSR